MKTVLKIKNILARGFSLVEICTVMGIISVMAAVAIPQIGSVNGAGVIIKNQENAQNIAQVYTAGKAAGVVWPDGKAAALEAITRGSYTGVGGFANYVFAAEGMSDQNVAEAAPYLDANMTYIEAGGQP